MSDPTDAIADQITSLDAEDLEALVEQCPRLDLRANVLLELHGTTAPSELARQKTDGAGEAE